MNKYPKQFLGHDFLLESELALRLYSNIKDLPIIDYHCHLDPAEIALNKRFGNITQAWLGGDHYKWRLMRANGVAEEFITGNASDYDKFYEWARTVEDLVGSALYHWSHLELRRFLGYEKTLSRSTAAECYEHCNNIMQNPNFDVWNILSKFNVELLCTTDDPCDTLEWHRKTADSGISTTVLPTFRPGRLLAVSSGFAEYIDKLGEVGGIKVTDFNSLKAVISTRVEFFHQNGCRLADVPLEPPVYADCTDEEADVIFRKALAGKLEGSEEAKLRTAIFTTMGRMFAVKGWAMQLHINALRNNNAYMHAKVGNDAGYDSILDTPLALPLNGLLNSLARGGDLPKTILYSLNPNDDDIIGTIAGNFQSGPMRGKMQHGAAWWFNDTKTGMEKQMQSLANTGMLARFVGMLTDSRSFLSYVRHEYFRRIMANHLANYVMRGEFPDDFNKLSEIASGIAYYNAKEYFGF
ncbi:MAG: glucuronate isomerase [Defluviitaleaceae bacterium]|nr:glucuronate isomerase [Defluviitaleaceae bacterium]